MFKKYIQHSEALKLLLDAVECPLNSERIDLEESYGRTVACDIFSPEDLPGFDRSSVDGFAVKAVDTYGAKETLPAYLTMVGEVEMGKQPVFKIRAGEAAKIPTGGMLPVGADAVVMLERAQIGGGNVIEVLSPVSVGENIIKADDDIKRGAIVAPKGRILRPQDIAALAGVGITAVDVVKKPIVSIISTGDEVVPYNKRAQLGQVRDINSFILAGLLSRDGAYPLKEGIFKDDYGIIFQALNSSIEKADMVLIVGGTSVGARDMTSAVIETSPSGRILFHGVAIKPGRPLIGGLVGSKLVLGLPGHPAAVAICYELYARPILEKMIGRETRDFVGSVSAILSKGVSSASGRRDHIRVKIEKSEEGYLAVPVLGKSGLIATLTCADGFFVIPEHKLGIDAGEKVTVILF